MMAIAAVPGYLRDKDFSTASPGMRFGMYFQGWRADFSKETGNVEALKRAGKMSPNDLATMKHLLARQQAAFRVAAGAASVLQLEAIATAPFSTGLGNEHPTENGFAFLNPYGLPYLPGSGVKGVLRQAARELATGEWGYSSAWDDKAIDALFGKEDSNDAQRGALTFWDVIPQIKGESLVVEIMTPHQKHYYQEGKNPHDSGQPVPISFLTVPPGSGFTFHVQCNLALLKNNTPALETEWQALLQAAFEHAFNWLGFGAKTAVGYGAMAEDQEKKIKREQAQLQQQEAERRRSLSPEQIAYEDHLPIIEKFRNGFEKAREGTYQPGQEFDSQRNLFIEQALSWEDAKSRQEAAELLRKTIQWGASKKGKERLKNSLIQLEENKA